MGGAASLWGEAQNPSGSALDGGRHKKGADTPLASSFGCADKGFCWLSEIPGGRSGLETENQEGEHHGRNLKGTPRITKK